MGDDLFELVPGDFMTGRMMPPEAIQDLLAIAYLDAGSVERVSDYLSKLQGLTLEENVKNGVQSCLLEPNEDLSESIVRTLLNLRPASVARTVKFVKQWRSSTEERRSVFTDEVVADLERNLLALVGEYPSIALLRKANRLLREVGNEFKGIAYFCDMRPVFDQPRKNVEGFVTLANMRMMYVSQDGDQHVCEVALTEEELRDLITRSEEALAKLGVLKATKLNHSINRERSS